MLVFSLMELALVNWYGLLREGAEPRGGNHAGWARGI